MKIVCLCQRGNSRSVALAWILKDKMREMKHEVIATGMLVTSRQTRRMLYDWADLIILVVGRYKHWIPEEYHHKLRVWDVGSDIYFRGFDDGLIKMFEEYIKNEGTLSG